MKLALITLIALMPAAALAGPRWWTTSQNTVGAVASMEAAIGMSKGSTRVVPQCGCTIRYLGARQVAPGVFDVRIQKLD